MNNREIIDRLSAERSLPKELWVRLLTEYSDDDRAYAAEKARNISTGIFGRKIYIRGIVEFSNICRNDCLYCGIRRSNTALSRYRLTEDEILECCAEGYSFGFRTFVLQSGEDAFFTSDRLADIVRKIKLSYPDCAVTLSVGELEYGEYKLLRDAGADRYLLRHETADREHYGKLHPAEMSWEHRMKCLRDLKSLGYQTGAGIMVGSPYQTAECIAKDMLFFEEFQPHMIGIGPFIPHKDTPFRDKTAGSYKLTLFLLSLCRIMLPEVLLPATTALGTIDPRGREEGVLAGANVIMPNLSPLAVRKKYMLYDNKICTGDESAQCRHCLEERMRSIGYELVIGRGDWQERRALK
ncbi:MAG: [FeFe] hydrogenase H-cluster radical SAM maturase HydE [Ruminococcus sp.]|nr:[FeFe] hydrogenase H-cluster radical SAM maturase HydE [Ruminococcus sp.]